MALYQPIKKEDINISMFIDLDKKTNVFYNNMYLENLDMVIKMPLYTDNTQIEKNSEELIKIEKFKLTKYIYLLDY